MKRWALLIGVMFHAGPGVHIASGQANIFLTDEFSEIIIPGEIPVSHKASLNPADSLPQGSFFSPGPLHTPISRFVSLSGATPEHRAFLTSPSHYASAHKDGILKLDAEKASSLRHGLELLAATYREVAKPIAGEDCKTLSLSITLQIQANPNSILEIVAAEVAANPSCSCEIVKAAIITNESSPDQVANIVEAAVTASPENIRLIAQCAIASSPESLAAIQAVLARLDPNSGESSTTRRKSAKSAKSGKGADALTDSMVDSTSSSVSDSAMANPLDMPSYVVPPPPVIAPPSFSNVNP